MSATEWRGQRASTRVCTFVEGSAGKRWFQLSDSHAPGIYALVLNQGTSRSHGARENATLSLLSGEEAPLFPLDLVIREARDTQALGQSSELLNHWRTTTTYARPSVRWFLLHAQANRQNRRRASDSLFKND